MANESSKLVFFTLPILPSLCQERLGQGRPSLQNTPQGRDGIVRDRLKGDFPIIGQGHQDFAAGLEPDLFADLSRDDDLAFSQGSHDRHMRSPYSQEVKRLRKKYN